METKDIKTIEDLYNFCKEIEKVKGFYTFKNCDLEKFENKGGVEIYFDDKETIDGVFPRIVHIGESSNFAQRLRDHKSGNKSGSSFRKNIGEAIENFFKEFPYWNKQEKESTEEEIKKELDEKVSQYIRELKFLLIDKGDKEKLIEIA
ncbi:MAG: GIY-YIG nuclease family protein, partial [Opitutales bacterium]|nr:GIY-YIG nuclease family protein [Opitutales bacterium]